MLIRASVPTLNDGPGDFEFLFRLARQTAEPGAEVELEFSGCRFLRQNAVALLGGLCRHIQKQGGQVAFAWHTMREAIATNLAQNGFAAAFGHGRGPWEGNSIPYREDRGQDADGIVRYLKDKWLGRGWVHVSEALRDAVVGRMWEIYANAFEHSGSPVGVFSCGQHFPGLGWLKLSVVDFGAGIPERVRQFHQGQDPGAGQYPAANCLKWAFQRGTTTRPGLRRGLGLDLLKELVRANRGKLEVYSGDGYAYVGETRERYTGFATSFQGTVVNIALRCDDNFYYLASEKSDAPLF